MPNLDVLIKQLALNAIEQNKPVNIVFGTVSSASPLVVKLDQKLSLTSEFLILTNNVKDYSVDVEISLTTNSEEVDFTHSHAYAGTTSQEKAYANLDTDYKEETHNHSYSGTTDSYTSSGSHSHSVSGIKKMIIKNGLKQGEKVILLRIQGGQRFIVLDRINEISCEGEWKNE